MHEGQQHRTQEGVTADAGRAVTAAASADRPHVDAKPRYITMMQAGELAPGQVSGNCIWRWCRKGVLARNGQRIRLQHVRIGGKLYTTAEWLAQFGAALAAADVDYFTLDNQPLPTAMSAPRGRTDKQRQAAIERAERELAEMGV